MLAKIVLILEPVLVLEELSLPSPILAKMLSTTRMKTIDLAPHSGGEDPRSG